MNIPLPSHILITPLPHKLQSAKVEISPLYPGYGVTIGNSLRRILLSSLEGTAVTGVKIQGANHEFSTLPYIKEEVLEIILNLKQLNIRLHTEEKERLILAVKGKKEVKASDFKKNSHVEIVNPDLHIASLTHENSELVLEAIIEKGLGFSLVDDREKEHEIGIIAVDAFFSPVKSVGYTVEDVRVGKRTDYDKLIIHIKTDGTIEVKDAIRHAAQILIEQCNFIYKECGGVIEEEAQQSDASEIKKTKVKTQKKRGRPKKNKDKV